MLDQHFCVNQYFGSTAKIWSFCFIFGHFWIKISQSYGKKYILTSVGSALQPSPSWNLQHRMSCERPSLKNTNTNFQYFHRTYLMKRHFLRPFQCISLLNKLTKSDRTSWSCGLICHEINRKVEGSNLAAAKIFFQLKSTKSFSPKSEKKNKGM